MVRITETDVTRMALQTYGFKKFCKSSCKTLLFNNIQWLDKLPKLIDNWYWISFYGIFICMVRITETDITVICKFMVSRGFVSDHFSQLSNLWWMPNSVSKGFWHCYENGLIKMIQTIPHNQTQVHATLVVILCYNPLQHL